MICYPNNGQQVRCVTVIFWNLRTSNFSLTESASHHFWASIGASGMHLQLPWDVSKLGHRTLIWAIKNWDLRDFDGQALQGHAFKRALQTLIFTVFKYLQNGHPEWPHRDRQFDDKFMSVRALQLENVSKQTFDTTKKWFITGGRPSTRWLPGRLAEQGWHNVQTKCNNSCYDMVDLSLLQTLEAESDECVEDLAHWPHDANSVRQKKIWTQLFQDLFPFSWLETKTSRRV